MSHLIASQIAIMDLEILRKAVAGFGGLTWMEGAKRFRSYTKDERLDTQVAEHGTCEHAIKIAGATYEIGVVKRKDGEGWNLVFDPYDHAAADKVGYQCEKVTAAYGEAYIRDFAEKNGFLVEQSTDSEGNVELCLTSSR